MNRKIWIIAGLLAGLTLIIWVFRGNSEEGNEIAVEVKQDDFVIEIIISGALEARQSVKITAPDGMMAANIYRTSISDL